MGFCSDYYTAPSWCLTGFHRRTLWICPIYPICARPLLSYFQVDRMELWWFVMMRWLTSVQTEIPLLRCLQCASWVPAHPYWRRRKCCPDLSVLVWFYWDLLLNFMFKVFVGYWPAQDTVVVAHEGTDPTQLYALQTFQFCSNSWSWILTGSLSILTDVALVQESLDTTLFPGIPSSVQVHAGFRNEHTLTALAILAEVKNLMASKDTKKVTCVSI